MRPHPDRGKNRLPPPRGNQADPPAEPKTSFKTETATKETHERWTINGIANVRAWAPAPPAREIVPAAIVERSKSPRLIVNPSPAPRSNPVPIAVAVRSPVHRNMARIPNVAVFWLIAPIAIVVEIVVADDVARNIS